MNTADLPRISRFTSNSDDDDSGCAMGEYTWVPAGLKHSELIHKYYSRIPEEKIPYVDTIGERYRIHQLLLQLPPHDNDPRYCQNLTEAEKRQFHSFNTDRKEKALGRASVMHLDNNQTCEKCALPILNDSVAVLCHRIASIISPMVDKSLENSEQTGLFHPECFVCFQCSELLVDLTYFLHDSKLFCGRHYCEQIRPRCSACDEIIFADECTEAEGRSWHTHHFMCSQCERNLCGNRYILRDGHPYCCVCFDTLFAELCDTCGDPIGVDEGQMAHDGQHWHSNDQCFCCQICQSSLIGKPFLPKYGNIFCSVDCSRIFAKKDYDGTDRRTNVDSNSSSTSRNKEIKKVSFDDKFSCDKELDKTSSKFSDSKNRTSSSSTTNSMSIISPASEPTNATAKTQLQYQPIETQSQHAFHSSSLNKNINYPSDNVKSVSQNTLPSNVMVDTSAASNYNRGVHSNAVDIQDSKRHIRLSSIRNDGVRTSPYTPTVSTIPKQVVDNNSVYANFRHANSSDDGNCRNRCGPIYDPTNSLIPTTTKAFTSSKLIPNIADYIVNNHNPIKASIYCKPEKSIYDCLNNSTSQSQRVPPQDLSTTRIDAVSFDHYKIFPLSDHIKSSSDFTSLSYPCSIDQNSMSTCENKNNLNNDNNSTNHNRIYTSAMHCTDIYQSGGEANDTQIPVKIDSRLSSPTSRCIFDSSSNTANFNNHTDCSNNNQKNIGNNASCSTNLYQHSSEQYETSTDYFTPSESNECNNTTPISLSLSSAFNRYLDINQAVNKTKTMSGPIGGSGQSVAKTLSDGVTSTSPRTLRFSDCFDNDKNRKPVDTAAVIVKSLSNSSLVHDNIQQQFSSIGAISDQTKINKELCSNNFAECPYLPLDSVVVTSQTDQLENINNDSGSFTGVGSSICYPRLSRNVLYHDNYRNKYDINNSENKKSKMISATISQGTSSIQQCITSVSKMDNSKIYSKISEKGTSPLDLEAKTLSNNSKQPQVISVNRENPTEGLSELLNVAGINRLFRQPILDNKIDKLVDCSSSTTDNAKSQHQDTGNAVLDIVGASDVAIKPCQQYRTPRTPSSYCTNCGLSSMHSDVRGNPPFTRMMLEPQSHNHDSYNPYCCQRTNNQDFTQFRGVNICQSKLRNQCRCKCVKDPQPHDVLCDQANNSRVEELCSVDCYSNSYLNHQNHQIHKPNQQLHFCSYGAPSIQRRDACICTGSVGACMKNASTALSTNEYPRQHDVYYQARFASTDHNNQNPYHVNKQMSSSDDSSSLDDESSWNFSSVQPQQQQQRNLPSNKLVGDALSASQNQRTDRLGLLPSTTCLKSKQHNHGIVVNPGKRRQLQYNNDPFHQQYHNRDDDKFHLMPVRVHENNMSTLPRKKLLNLKEECQQNVDSNNRLSNCDFAYHQMPSSDDNSSRRRCDGAVSTEIACDNAESAGCHSYGVRVCYLDEDLSLVDNSVEYDKTTANDGSNGQSGHCDTTTVGKGNYDKNAIFVVSGSGGDSVVGMKSVTFGNTNVSGKVKLLRGVNTSTEHTQIPVVDKNNNQMHQTGSESCGAKSSKALSSNSGKKHQQSTQKNCIIS